MVLQLIFDFQNRIATIIGCLDDHSSRGLIDQGPGYRIDAMKIQSAEILKLPADHIVPLQGHQRAVGEAAVLNGAAQDGHRAGQPTGPRPEPAAVDGQHR